MQPLARFLNGDVTYIQVFSSRWCMNHYQKYYSGHSVYKGVCILRGYFDQGLIRPSTVYSALVDTDQEREVRLFGENLDTIRLMVTRWKEGRLNWDEVVDE